MTKKTIKRTLFIAIPLVLIASFLLPKYFQDEAPLFMTVKPSHRDIVSKVFSTGTLAGKTEVDIGAQVSGQIQKIYVKTGDEVKEGDLLCQIDPEILQNELDIEKSQEDVLRAKIESMKALLNTYEKAYIRAQKLYKTKTISEQDYDSALSNFLTTKYDLKSLEAELIQQTIAVQRATTNLSYTKITAPMDGTIYAIPVEEGQTVNANQTTPTILKMATLDTMVVETEISEADVIKVKEGLDCTFTIFGMPGHEFKATLREIELAPESAMTDSSSTTSAGNDEAIYYNAKLEVDNKDRLLRIDMTADVSIFIDKRDNVLAIPLSTIREDYYDGTAKVLVLENGVAQDKVIKIGLRDEQYVEVLSELDINTDLIVGDDIKSAEMAAMMNNKSRAPRGPR